MTCQFTFVGDGVCCIRCGRFVKTVHPPERVHAKCREPEPPYVHARRFQCQMCEAFYGRGRCKQIDLGCGRTYRAWLWDGTKACPLGKWDAVQ